jgi:hypothetical protein
MGMGVLTAEVASAQDTRPQTSPTPSSTRATTPWYEQFSLGGPQAQDPNRWSGSQSRASVRVTPNQQSRWAVQVDVNDRDRTQLRQQQSVAAGAYYNFTPRIRVGGEVSFSSTPNQDLARTAPDAGEAGVRVQSAFRF